MKLRNPSSSNLLQSHKDIIVEEIPDDTVLPVDIVSDSDSEHNQSCNTLDMTVNEITWKIRYRNLMVLLLVIVEVQFETFPFTILSPCTGVNKTIYNI